MAQRVKRLPATQETWVQSLGGEDPLEKEMATHSSILAWKTPWMEKPGGLHGVTQSQTRLSDFTSLSYETECLCKHFGKDTGGGMTVTCGLCLFSVPNSKHTF